MPEYLSRVFPWSLNYMCGGPGYPSFWSGEVPKKRWRRVDSAAVLLPLDFAGNMARRVECQISGDWMLVPTIRKLSTRYDMLRGSFTTAFMTTTRNESLDSNASSLVQAAESIYKCLILGTVSIGGIQRPVVGDIGQLRHADGLGMSEARVLQMYERVTASLPASQAMRRRLGRAMFGFRVVYGDGVFIKISPSRRHSALILRLSRARRNDPMLSRQDDVSSTRKRFCRHSEPSIFMMDASTEINFPPLSVRQGLNARDPLASVFHYDVCIRIILARLCGLRMCL